MNRNLKKSLLVLGMHRSGTSALTRVLNLLGVTLGDDLLGIVPNSNAKGHFESLPILRLQDNMLIKIESSWDDDSSENPAIDNKKLNDEIDTFTYSLKDVIVNETKESILHAFKEPRTALFIDKWIETLKMLNYDCASITPLRYPSDVTLSLKTRDGMNPNQGYLLWLIYNLNAEEKTREISRSFINFRDLVDDWQIAMSKIAKDLDLTWPVGYDKSKGEIDDFISKKLEHHRSIEVCDSSSKLIRGYVEEVFEALTKLINNPYDKSSQKKLDLIRQSFYHDLAKSTELHGHWKVSRDEFLHKYLESKKLYDETSALIQNQNKIIAENESLKITSQETIAKLENEKAVLESELNRANTRLQYLESLPPILVLKKVNKISKKLFRR